MVIFLRTTNNEQRQRTTNNELVIHLHPSACLGDSASAIFLQRRFSVPDSSESDRIEHRIAPRFHHFLSVPSVALKLKVTLKSRALFYVPFLRIIAPLYNRHQFASRGRSSPPRLVTAAAMNPLKTS